MSRLKKRQYPGRIMEEPRMVIADLIIEGILAGIFRTCEAVQLTQFGQWVVEPFKDVLADDLAAKTVEKVFQAANQDRLSDTEFLRHFVELSLKPGKGGLGLLEVLNEPDTRAHVAAALGAASIQFGVFLVLCGVYCKTVAECAHRVTTRDGSVSLAR